MPISLSVDPSGTSTTLQLGGQNTITLKPGGASAGAAITSDNFSEDFATTRFAAARSPQSLVNLAYPSSDGGGRDIARAGWLPVVNQQWGGAYHFTELQDAATGATYKFEPATGNVQDDNIASIGLTSSQYYIATGFKVAESATFDAVWLKLAKVGNPTGNIIVRIYSDNGAGSPSAAIGSAVTISARLLTGKTDGEWYRVAGLAAGLTAGTQYHIVATINTVDASNYVFWKVTNAKKYPFGSLCTGTSAPVWTQYTAVTSCFLVEPPSSNALLQSGGRFDRKLVFGGLSTQPGQQKVLTQPMRNFYDGKNFTFLQRLNTIGVSQTIADFVYGLDHDRILVGTNAGGYPFVTLYTSAGSTYSVTGTASVATGDQDIAVVARTFGDGADYLKLYVNGVSVGTALISQTFVMDGLMRELGTAYSGGGFGAAPTWTGSLSFASLPSAQGWTYAGTATEANAFSVANGKLYQNKNGYAATDTGYYAKSSAGLNNATGWTVSWKCRIENNVASTNEAGVQIRVYDGVKLVDISIAEYYLKANISSGGTVVTYQGDFKSQERVFVLYGKGSDYYLFVDGRLVIDGTGGLTGTTSTNSIWFGDASNGSGDNADAIWSYVKYSTAGMLLPTPASGASLSEQAYWSGDQSALLPLLWNSGSPVSVKKLCGVTKNYIDGRDAGVSREVRRGVASGLTTTSTALVAMPDLEAFIHGSYAEISTAVHSANSVAGNTNYAASVFDGINTSTSAMAVATVPMANTWVNLPINTKHNSYLGLHKCNAAWSTNSGTATLNGAVRSISVEAKV